MPGDVLLQVLFHAQIGRECGKYTHMDVTCALCRKMICRQPHVFANGTASTSAEALDAWAKIKIREHGEEERSRYLDGIPASMVQQMRAYMLQKKAVRVGFDWPAPAGARDKLREELGDFREELKTKNESRLQDDGGDELFAVVNLLRMVGVDSRDAAERMPQIRALLRIHRRSYAKTAGRDGWAVGCGKGRGEGPLNG